MLWFCVVFVVYLAVLRLCEKWIERLALKMVPAIDWILRRFFPNYWRELSEGSAPTREEIDAELDAAIRRKFRNANLHPGNAARH